MIITEEELLKIGSLLSGIKYLKLTVAKRYNITGALEELLQIHDTISDELMSKLQPFIDRCGRTGSTGCYPLPKTQQLALKAIEEIQTADMDEANRMIYGEEEIPK